MELWTNANRGTQMLKDIVIRRLLNRFLKEQDINSLRYSITKYIDPKCEKLVLVDVGANRGRFYDEASEVFSQAQIKALLIEPIPECAGFLQKKYETKSYVFISETAANDKKERMDFYINQFDETSSLLRIKSEIRELRDINTLRDKTITVASDTLDNIIEDCCFFQEPIDILKIDVQGSEDRVLKGATRALAKTKFIWIEGSLKALYEGSCLFNDIHLILSMAGYCLLEIADGHRSPDKELLQVNCLYKKTNN